MAMLREPDAAPVGGDATAPVAHDPSLCSSCNVNPRHSHGRLSRCLPCIRVEAQRFRDARAAAEALVAARRMDLTKTCRSCGTTKPLAEYMPHASAKDGRRHDCRSCVAKGRAKTKQTPERRARDRQRAQSPERRARNLEAVHRWQATNRAAMEAHRAVAAAITAGTLVPPKGCQAIGCKKRRRLNAHHNRYGPKGRLKVAWLCAGHHRSVHAGLPLRLKAGAAFSVARAPKAA